MPTQRDPGIRFRLAAATTALMLWPYCAVSQKAPSGSSQDQATLTAAVRQLSEQVQVLNSQLNEMRDTQVKTLQEIQTLREELRKTEEQLARQQGPDRGLEAAGQPQSPTTQLDNGRTSAIQESSSGTLDERVTKLEDEQALLNDKVTEQSQTKVESGSKYRVRLYGMLLVNLGVTRGSVDNLDFPQIATPPEPLGTSEAFFGSARQSEIGIEAFGPTVAGASTSANVQFDFAGGFPALPNGDAFGIMRLRTAVVRMDWGHTSIVAGQDSLFFAPLTPTTLSSLAIPALSYSGNLWSWTPQLRVEHRFTFSESSNVLLQGGILDSSTGDIPEPGYGYRYPTVGEQSGQPAYAARTAWNGKPFGRSIALGLSGYYGRQSWGFGRSIDGWAGITDATVPLTSVLDFTAEFYRGRAVAGLGGGIGQSVLLTGELSNATTQVDGLDSMGGWAQLKYKPRNNFSINFAYGQDNPFASELRAYPATENYYGSLLSRNRSFFLNFIYRMRSDVLLSVQYQRIMTNTLDANSNAANQVTTSMGYLF